MKLEFPFSQHSLHVVASLALILATSVACPGLAQSEPSATISKSKVVDKSHQHSFELNERGVQAIGNKNFEQAEDFFRRALAADTGNITAVFNLSGMYINNKKQQSAIALLTEYIKEYPTDAGLYTRRGDAYFSIRNTELAAKDYQESLKLEPTAGSVAAKLGTLYTLQKDMVKAEEMYLKAVENEPKNAQLLQNLSNLFLLNGKTDKAISTAKRGLQVLPSADLYVTLGNAYEVQKDFKNSLIAFQRASDLGLKSDDLTQKIQALKKFHS